MVEKSRKEIYERTEWEKGIFYHLSNLGAVCAAGVIVLFSPLEIKQKDELLRRQTGIDRIPGAVHDCLVAEEYLRNQIDSYELLSNQSHPPYYSSRLVGLLDNEYKEDLESLDKRIQVVMEDIKEFKEHPEYKEYQLTTLNYNSQKVTHNIPKKSLRVFGGLGFLAGLSYLIAKRKEKKLKELIEEDSC